MVNQTRIVMRALEDFEEDIIRDVSVFVVAELQERTPIDTGWANANWIPSVGTPAEFDIPELDRDERFAGVPSALAQAEAGRLRLFNYKLRDGAAFITNNVPYIVDLNMGSSTKAPANFVTAAIRQAIADVERFGR